MYSYTNRRATARSDATADPNVVQAWSWLSTPVEYITDRAMESDDPGFDYQSDEKDSSGC